MIRTTREEPFESYWEFEDALEQMFDEAELESENEIPRGTPPYVEWVQAALNRVANEHLGVDGDAGPATRAAVRRFRQQRKLPAGDQVDAATEAELIAAGAGPAPTVRPMVAAGVDASTSLASHVPCLQSELWNGQHLTFVIRYYSNDGPPKDLTAIEAKVLSEAGLQIVAVWEASGGTMAYFTRARGEQHGYHAFKKALAVGQPSPKPIYFAIDNVDPTTAADKRHVLEYFEGVQAGMARAQGEPGAQGVTYAIGVYGSWNTLDWCRDQGIATWFWQSCSTGTSGGKSRYLWPGANLRQVKCERRMCGIRVDVDEAYADAGGWTLPVAPWADWPSIPWPPGIGLVAELEDRKASCTSPVGGNYGPPTPVCRGTPPYLEWVQSALNRVLGLKLAVDGQDGARTRSAVRQFQDREKITEKGVGQKTEAALVAAGAGPVPVVPQVTAIGIDHDIELTKYIPCLKTMKKKGVPLTFVVRYYTYKAGKRLASKNLKPAEALALAGAGIKCVAVWEFYSFASPHFLDGLGTYRKAGEDHGHTACLRAKECGQPSGTPIYFGIDELDVESAADAKNLTEYFDGVKAGMDRASAELGLSYEVGCYSRWSVLDLVRDQGIVKWFWQSCSTGTSRGRSRYLWPGSNMRQVRCGWPWRCESPAWPSHVDKDTGVRKTNYPDLDESYGNEGGWFTTLAAAPAAGHELEGEIEYDLGTPIGVDRTSADYIGWLQHWIRTSGVNVAVDGTTGPNTRTAIRRFQKQHGLQQTGDVDDATEAAVIAVGNEQPPQVMLSVAAGVDASVPLNAPATLACLASTMWGSDYLEFVVRYYSPAGNAKNLTPAEALALGMQGLKVVAVWERFGNSTEMTHAQGVSHATQAFAMAQSCGQPTGTPIYFAFDADPAAGDKARILDYFTGVRDGMAQAAAAANSPGYTIGVYAPGAVLGWCRDQGIATFFWQSAGTGWAGNYQHWPDAHIRQVAIERTLDGGCATKVDFDEAYVSDYGAWWYLGLDWSHLPAIPLLFEAESEAEEELGHQGFRARRRKRLGYEASESDMS